MGAVTPIGIGVQTFWQSLLAGKCGIGAITSFDAAALPVRIAAEIGPLPEDCLQNLPRTAAPFMQFAFLAGSEALAQSGLNVLATPERVGICVATAMACRLPK